MIPQRCNGIMGILWASAGLLGDVDAVKQQFGPGWDRRSIDKDNR
jgi:hypothetical protein